MTALWSSCNCPQLGKKPGVGAREVKFAGWVPSVFLPTTVPWAVDCLLPFSSTPFLFDSWEPCYGTFPLTTVIFLSFHAIPCGPPLQYSRTVTPTRCYIFKIVSVNEMPLGNTIETDI